MNTLRRVATGVLVAVFAGGCGGGPPATEPAHATGSALEAAAEADPIADEGSLYDLSVALTGADGRPVALADLRGRPFVASMIYTQCTSVCPRVTADLQRLERALPAEARERLGIVLFSLDPARDHPQALRAFAREHGLDSTHWALYSSREDDMRTLAAVLGVRHRPDGDGEIAHSAIVAVVDTGGRIRHRQVGIQDDIAPLVAAVTAVTSSPRR